MDFTVEMARTSRIGLQRRQWLALMLWNSLPRVARTYYPVFHEDEGLHGRYGFHHTTDGSHLELVFMWGLARTVVLWLAWGKWFYTTILARICLLDFTLLLARTVHTGFTLQMACTSGYGFHSGNGSHLSHEFHDANGSHESLGFHLHSGSHGICGFHDHTGSHCNSGLHSG